MLRVVGEGILHNLLAVGSLETHHSTVSLGGISSFTIRFVYKTVKITFV